MDTTQAYLDTPIQQGSRVLIIDDEPMLRRTLADYLEDMGYETRTAANGAEGLASLDQWPPDAVLVDLNMPVMDGYAFIEKARIAMPDLPLVVVSGVGTVDKALDAVRLGAWDYITKPVARFDVVLHTLNRVLERAAMIRENRNYQQNLELLVRDRTAELEDTRRQVIYSLGKAAEYRDNETGRHVIRVGEMSAVLGTALGLSPEHVDMLRESAPLHDIGKIGIPDHILLKPGPLDADEWAIMKRHCEFGCMILSQPLADGSPSAVCVPGKNIVDNGSPMGLMQMAQVIALSHHERWDGSGYPAKLAGESIPIEARIVALIDVYDAVGSTRTYKEAFDEETCQRIVREGSGTHFDPKVVDAFFANIKSILFFKERWRDV